MRYEMHGHFAFHGQVLTDTQRSLTDYGIGQDDRVVFLPKGYAKSRRSIAKSAVPSECSTVSAEPSRSSEEVDWVLHSVSVVRRHVARRRAACRHIDVFWKCTKRYSGKSREFA